MKIYTKKIIGLLCFVFFLLAASAALTALAEEPSIPSDLTGNTDYLVIHETTGNYPLGGNSSIQVTKDDTLIAPTQSGDTLAYTNIPDGAEIKIDYAFHLEDGADGTIYTYNNHHTFTITLPEGISFETPSGDLAKIMATDADTGTLWQMGTWTISNNIVTVTFSDEIANHTNMWGKIKINGTFTALSEGDNGATQMNLGNQSITFTREQPPEAKPDLEKEGTYDAETHSILWKVTVNPNGLPLDGYNLLDTYSDNQTYQASSFSVNESSILDELLTRDADQHQISYTFPTNTSGIQTVTYRTSPTTYAGTNGTATFENTAVINKNGQAVSDPAKDDVTINWINKETSNSAPSGAIDDTIRKWTVTVNMPEGGSFTEAQIIDTLPEGLELITDSDSYPVQIKLNDSNAATVIKDTVSDVNGVYTFTSGKLTYTFPTYSDAVAGKAILTYYTKVTNRQASLDNNKEIKFTNQAEFKWKNLTVTAPGDSATTAIGPGGLISKSADGKNNYSPDKKYIPWTITVNKNKVTVPQVNAIVTDTISTGQKLVIDSDHLFIVKNGADPVVTFDALPSSGNLAINVTDGIANGFVYSFNQEITSTYTITYFTEITDFSSLYVNGNVNFGNQAFLGTGESEYPDVTTPKTFSSQILAKSSLDGGYDYSTHTAKWQIVVNRNQLPLTNAQLTDTLPEGMVMLIDAEHPFTLKKNDDAPTYITGTNEALNITPKTENTTESFVYSFGAEPISDTYTITFYTKLLDEALISQWSGNKAFTNQASLKADEYTTTINASASINIKNPILSKSYTYTQGSDSISWRSIINTGLLELKDAVVADILNSGLQLDANSLKLYEVTIDKNSEATDPVLLESDAYSVEFPTTDNNNTLKIHLPDGKKAYSLAFNTSILTDDITFVNEINLTGNGNTPNAGATANQFSVTDLYSNAGSGSNKLTVYKDDGNGKSVAGATYQLLNVNKQPIKKAGNIITAITDANGNAVFENLPSWVFYVHEINAPDDYLLNPDIFGGDRLSGDQTVSTSDQLAVGDLEFTKTSTTGALLSGGEFTLTGADDGNKTFTSKASSIDGKVSFKSVPLGNYRIQETKAPNGYYLSDEKITASVTYNASKTGVNTSVSPDQLANIAIPPIVVPNGSIEVLKTDTDGAPLSNAKFGLYTTSGALLKTATSDEKGLVTFTDIPVGSYLVREISAPEGFILSDTEATATITSDNLNIKANPGTITNVSKAELLIGSIELLKTNRANEPLSGAEFGLYDLNGALIMNVASNDKGLIIFDKVPLGDYIIKEIAPPIGYTLSETEATASVTQDNLNVVGNPYTFVNDLSTNPILHGSIELKKTDDNFNPLSGAEFGLYGTDGVLIKTAISNSEGIVLFAQVPYGSYTIKEVTPPKGHVLSDTESTVSVTAEKSQVKAIPYTIVNYSDKNPLKHGSVQIIKIDAQTKAPLPGAVFTIYNEDGAVIQTATTNSLGFATFAEVTPGSYTIRETTAPTGYLLSNEVINLVVELNKSYEYTYANTAITGSPDGNSTGSFTPGDKTSDTNQTGTQKDTLPQTGGFWDATTLGLLGASLVILGIVLNYLNRKKQKYEKYEEKV